jgi:hypothetical protein
MKHAWIAVLVAVLAIPTMATAQAPTADPVPAWCGGSYGAAGTSFGQCVSVEGTTQVAGEGSGIKEQKVSVPTQPEYPSTKVSFEGDKAFFDSGDSKKELNLSYVQGRDLSGEMQSPGGEGTSE